MKKRIYTFSILLLFSIAGYSQEINVKDSSTSNKTKFIPRTFLPLILDPGLTMKSGAESIITLHHVLTTSEDNLLGTRWFSESTILGKAGGIISRLAKYGLLDLPIDYFSIVFAHEYFGHGARYRELDMDNIHYAYDLPPPYGKGGGEASNSANVQISTHQLLSIWEGGVEVHPIINRNLSMRWMANNKMNYREASQYFWSFQIAFSYFQDTEENLNDGLNDNDPRAYVRIINANSGYYDLNNLELSVKDLKSKVLLNMVNPFLVYSMYSILKTFLWDGDISNEVPTIKLGSFNFLPSLRTALTPFGVEYHFENYLRYQNIISLIDFSYGDQSFHKNWGGLGLQINNIYENSDYSLDIKLNIWNQPDLQFGLNPTNLRGGGFGAAFSARGYYALSTSSLPISAVLEIGYKSVGFLEGYNMDSSPIIMFGFAASY